jgi:FixJ family two-component response regulator
MSHAEPTVFIVDDDLSVRESLTELMKSVSIPVRAFASAQEFLKSYEPNLCGCVLLDVRMSEMSGLRLQEELGRRNSDLPIIFVTGHGDVPTAVQAMQKGASDFLEKPIRGQVIIETVQRAFERSSQRQRTRAKVADVDARLAFLTRRETDILSRLKSGQRTKQVSHEFGLSRKTIDAHLTSIREKLGVETTAQMLLLLQEVDQLRSSVS